MDIKSLENIQSCFLKPILVEHWSNYRKTLMRCQIECLRGNKFANEDAIQTIKYQLNSFYKHAYINTESYQQYLDKLTRSVEK